MTGQVIAMFVAPARHAGQIAVTSVQLKTGKGIVGDRFFGFRKTQPGRNMTLIEWEVIEEFKRSYQLNIPLNATRRNLITKGVRLNDLVGKTFKIGHIVCRGIELCEPCKVMSRQFPGTSLSDIDIIRHFNGKAGIRASVIAGGIVDLGDNVNLS
ncbi:hypothetical protein MCAMS1_00883 [biofilm metagenome]